MINAGDSITNCQTAYAPYKHYDAGLTEDVLDGVVSEEDTETEDYPCEGTMKHWRWRAKMNEKNMEGQIIQRTAKTGFTVL